LSQAHRHHAKSTIKEAILKCIPLREIWGSMLSANMTDPRSPHQFVDISESPLKVEGTILLSE